MMGIYIKGMQMPKRCIFLQLVTKRSTIRDNLLHGNISEDRHFQCDDRQKAR